MHHPFGELDPRQAIGIAASRVRVRRAHERLEDRLRELTMLRVQVEELIAATDLDADERASLEARVAGYRRSEGRARVLLGL